MGNRGMGLSKATDLILLIRLQRESMRFHNSETPCEYILHRTLCFLKHYSN